MHPLFHKTFGGLSPYFYFRHLLFGCLMPALFLFFSSKSPDPVPFSSMVYMAVNTLLYPYSRFVYSTIMDFIRGDTVYMVNGLLLLIWNIVVLMACWTLALVIAPIGLLGIYIYHTRAERKQAIEEE